MMRVSNHGGRCCGIKHIHGFPYRPDAGVLALPKREVYHGAAGEMQNPGKDFYPGPCPAETGKVRLEELLKYIDTEKSAHLVEVVLSTGIASNWKKTLTDFGFKEVTRFKNSNTEASLVVFHRVTPLPKPVKKPRKKSQPVKTTEGDTGRN